MDLEFITKKINQNKQIGLHRKLKVYDDVIDFFSNDYYGFASIIPNSSLVYNKYPSGSTGSRLISGNNAIAILTEKEIAKKHNAESSLIYNCGYMANLGLFSCIANRNDIVIYDEYIHASIIEGVRLSNAKRIKFKHNDIEDLNSVLSKCKNLQNSDSKIFVAIESIYSMDGDIALLQEISNIVDYYKALLIVDEAHSTGIIGNKGSGMVCSLGLEDKVFARVHTFGKAMGLHGAAVVGSQLLVDFLVNFSKPFIYTTAPSPDLYQKILLSYDLISEQNKAKLFWNIDYFVQKAQKCDLFTWKLNASPIQNIIIQDNIKTKYIANQMVDKGFGLKAILSPTVKEGTERIRISLHSFNTKEEIDTLFDAFYSLQL